MSPVVVWSPASLNTGNRGGSLYPGSPVTLPPPGCPVTLYPAVVCIMLMLHRHASRCSHCSINVIFSSCILAYLQLDRYCNIKSERKVLSIVYLYFCITLSLLVTVASISLSMYEKWLFSTFLRPSVSVSIPTMSTSSAVIWCLANKSGHIKFLAAI